MSLLKQNEWTAGECCSPESGDQLDFVRAKHGWGVEEGITIFGTEKVAKKYYILVGTQEKLDPEASAMLVSDPIQCQEGDGQLEFKYWTSPRTSVRVCIRNTSTIKQFDWCSRDITKGDPGPALITIPGSILYDFEIVIEARNFSYDAFGFQGGVVILDDIKYNASAVYNCKNIPHIEPIPPKSCALLNCEFESEESECLSSLKGSDWQRSDEIVGKMKTKRSGAFIYVGSVEEEMKDEKEENEEKTDENQIFDENALQNITDQQNNNENVRRKPIKRVVYWQKTRKFSIHPRINNTKHWQKKDKFMKIDPQKFNKLIFKEANITSDEESLNEDSEADKKLNQLLEMLEKEGSLKNEGETQQLSRFHIGDFELPRQIILEFCVYLSGEKDRLVVESEMKGYCRSTLVEFNQFTTRLNKWECYHLILHAGNYTAIDFIAHYSSKSSVALDSLKLLELDGCKCACPDMCTVLQSEPVEHVNEMFNSTMFMTQLTGCLPTTTFDQTTSNTLPQLVTNPTLNLNDKPPENSELLSNLHIQIKSSKKVAGISRKRIGSDLDSKIKSVNGLMENSTYHKVDNQTMGLISHDNKTAQKLNDYNTIFNSTDYKFLQLKNLFQPKNIFQQEIPLPKSFPIQQDNIFTPLAKPTPSNLDDSIQFGGLDNNLNLMDFSAELQKLEKNKTIKFGGLDDHLNPMDFSAELQNLRKKPKHRRVSKF